MGFVYRDGYLYCDDICLKDLQQGLHNDGVFPSSPLFVYSKDVLVNNVRAYKDALNSLSNETCLNFSLKANANPHLLQILKEKDCSVTLVSGNELRLALQLGFSPSQIVINGNGKYRWETKLAVETGCFINVDSTFDLQQTIEVSREMNLRANVLLRLNLNIDAHVHPYISTGMAGSKFGIDEEKLEDVLHVIKNNSCLNVAGLHCHLGSTIEDLTAFRLCLKKMKEVSIELNRYDFIDIKYINIGGGLNINYHKHSDKTRCIDKDDLDLVKKVDDRVIDLKDKDEQFTTDFNIVHAEYKNKKVSRLEWKNKMEENSILKDIVTERCSPTPKQLIDVVEETNFDKSITIIVEPGRSLVGNTAVLLAQVLGCKESGNTKFIVTTASMTEIIRPSLYNAYHHIDFTEPVPDSPPQEYDIVGPVCESSDFLGKNRFLKTPHQGCGIAVWDAGAYCSSMSSNYNFRARPAEVLVSGSEWKLIRRPDSFEEMMTPFNFS